jgi:hypothetical protein
MRATWARHKASRRLPGKGGVADRECSVRFVFVVGDASSPPADGRSSAAAAAEASGDMLRVPVAEGYRRISDKVISALQWAAEDPTAEAEYVLKTDDDSFVCVTRLLERLHRVRAGLAGDGFAQAPGGAAASDAVAGAHARGGGLYYGKFTRHPVPVELREGEPLEDSAYVESFGRRVYPLYAQGAGYVLSRVVVRRVARGAARLSRPLPVVEDALVGTLVRQLRVGTSGGDTTPDEEFDDPHVIAVPHRNPKTYCRRTFAISHHLRAEEMALCEAEQPTC